MTTRAGSVFSSRAFACLALAGLVFASRAWLIQTWGSSLPFWDQWGIDAALHRAWLTGTLQWRDLFAAHNEHRISLTRLADLGLFITGGWNPWAQLVLNAALHALTAAVLAAAFWPPLGPRARASWLAGVAVIFCATAGWQNALWGFQSQVYFGNALAAIALAALASSRPDAARSWLGCGAAALALFSNAGGLLVAAVALLLAWPRERTLRAWAPAAVLLATLALGWMLRVEAAQHASLHAKSVGQFLAVFVRCLGWPHVDSGWAWLVLQAPLVLLAAQRLRARAPFTAAERCALALGAFAVLHAAAVAYTRSAGLPDARPLSRYQDPLLLGAAAQWFAAVRLASTGARRARLAALGWAGFALAGLLALTATNLSLHLPYRRAQDVAALAHVRAFAGVAPKPDLPENAYGWHPDPATVRAIVTDPILRPVLPAAVRGESPPPWPIAHRRALAALAGVIFLLALVATARRSDGAHAPVPAEPRAP